MPRFQELRNQLATVYPAAEGNRIAEMAFEHATGLQRAALIREPNRTLTDQESSRLAEMETQLLAGEPIQYVIGEAWFYQRCFRVSPAVLIPRPETEELTERVIRFLTLAPAPVVLDVGTGSGCIAISLQLALPQSRVTGMDVSAEALAIAHINGQALKANVNWKQGNVLLKPEWTELPLFDLIVSNPPYIPLGEKQEMDAHVAMQEPALALFVPDDRPLLFYEALADLAIEKLKPEGRLMVEIHSAFGLDVVRLFEEKGMQATLVKDLFEKDRIVEATRCR